MDKDEKMAFIAFWGMVVTIAILTTIILFM